MVIPLRPRKPRSVWLWRTEQQADGAIAPHLVFKVAGKMFALCQLSESPLQLSLKCEPELAEQLRLAHPAVIPGYHLNKRHWNTVIIDGSLPDEMIGDMLEDSYDLVVSQLPKARQRALAWRSGA
ncbi:MAG TPA: MmcQ/YjbR family DNA-binding protein [Solirubrobacteraceae bacterium]